MNTESQLWYVKVKGKVKGPFATGLISKDILLGRIHPSDLLSQDREVWRKASTIREVLPEVIKYRNEPNYKERLRAARRWADERDTVREIDDNGQSKHYQPRKKVTHLRIKTTSIVGLLGVAAIISGIIFVMFMFTPDNPLAKIDCFAPIAAGASFDGCHLPRKDFSRLNLKSISLKNALLKNTRFTYTDLSGSHLDYANLSHADLSHAKLIQASLRAADLRGAYLNATDLSQADLSYADLSGAKAARINLSGTLLNQTIWFDGQVCKKGSVSQCQK